MPSSHEEFIQSLKEVADRIGPGWQEALQAALKTHKIRTHAAEVKDFVRQLRAVPAVPVTSGDQLDFGGTTLELDGVVVAEAFVSSGTSDHKVWIEDWIIRDDAGFTNMMPSPGQSCQLKYGGTYGTGPDAALLGLTTGTSATTAWRATQVGSYIAAANIPSAPSITVEEFKLTQGTNLRGHLFREVYTQNGETWIDDHWVLRMTFAYPTSGNPITVTHVSSSANLATELDLLKTEAGTTGSNRPKNYIFLSARLREYPPL